MGYPKNGTDLFSAIFGVGFHGFRAAFKNLKRYPCHFEVWGKPYQAKKKKCVYSCKKINHSIRNAIFQLIQKRRCKKKKFVLKQRKAPTSRFSFRTVGQTKNSFENYPTKFAHLNHRAAADHFILDYRKLKFRN